MASYTSHILLFLFRSVKCTISVSEKTIQQVEAPRQDENIEPGRWEWGDRGHVLLICPEYLDIYLRTTQPLLMGADVTIIRASSDTGSSGHNSVHIRDADD